MVRDCIMVGTEFPNVAFGNLCWPQVCQGFLHLYIYCRWSYLRGGYDTSIEGTHTRFPKCGDNIFRTVGL